MKKELCLFLLGLFCFNSTWGFADIEVKSKNVLAQDKKIQDINLINLSFEECVQIALQNNHKRLISKFSVDIAEAQYSQVLSARWPTFKIESLYSIRDEDPKFVFPAEECEYQAWSALAPVWATTRARLPQKDVKILNKQNFYNTLKMTYPLYTGGKVTALINMAKYGIEVAKEEFRRTDLEVIYDVKKMYYACILAEKLYKEAKDSFARLNTTLEITEMFYKKGSGRVKKTDYLKNKMTLEYIRSVKHFLKGNLDLAYLALVNTMGLSWERKVNLGEKELPFFPYNCDLKELVSTSYEFNPDWAKLENGLMASMAAIKEAKSGYCPTVALTGEVRRIFNDYNYGLVPEVNKKGWMVGLAIQFPIFNGFLTRGKVKEAIARVKKLKQQRLLLKEGLALQIKAIFLEMDKTKNQKTALQESLKAARELRSLNERAYKESLVETKDVIESQIMESLVFAQYYKIIYSHIAAQAHLDFVLGKEISKKISSENV